jgi:uncharacterized protein (DUF1330 family)
VFLVNFDDIYSNNFFGKSHTKIAIAKFEKRKNAQQIYLSENIRKILGMSETSAI